jgi:hypothetical protein
MPIKISSALTTQPAFGATSGLLRLSLLGLSFLGLYWLA